MSLFWCFAPCVWVFGVFFFHLLLISGGAGRVHSKMEPVYRLDLFGGKYGVQQASAAPRTAKDRRGSCRQRDRVDSNLQRRLGLRLLVEQNIRL